MNPSSDPRSPGKSFLAAGVLSLVWRPVSQSRGDSTEFVVDHAFNTLPHAVTMDVRDKYDHRSQVRLPFPVTLEEPDSNSARRMGRASTGGTS